MEEDERRWVTVIPTVVACLITVLWAASFLRDMFVESYDPHPSITPIMLSAAGFLFGREFVRKWIRTNGHSNGKATNKRRTDDRE